jgi:crossover junction endodeoxyribonuclease RuvC
MLKERFSLLIPLTVARSLFHAWLLLFLRTIRRLTGSRFLRLFVLILALTILTKPKIILGIDPGTNILGYGVISVDSKGPHYVDMGVFDLRKIKDPFEKLANIFAGVGELLEQHNPDELAVESPFYGKNAQVILKLGRAQGAAITAAVMRGIPVAEYAPRKAKIAICGNGAASKEQVAMMIQKTLHVELDPKYLDATDALAIALCHHYQISNPLAGVGGKSDWKKFLENNPDRIKK